MKNKANSEQGRGPSARPAFAPCKRCGHKFSEHRSIDPPPWYWRRCSVAGCTCHGYTKRASRLRAEASGDASGNASPLPMLTKRVRESGAALAEAEARAEAWRKAAGDMLEAEMDRSDKDRLRALFKKGEALQKDAAASGRHLLPTADDLAIRLRAPAQGTAPQAPTEPTPSPKASP